MSLIAYKLSFTVLQKCLLLWLLCLSSVQASGPIYGDSKCWGEMCVTAYVNSTSTTTFKLSLKKPKQSIGWMAMGFGEGMLFSPMVIMWHDGQGKVTLSQRKAVSYLGPEVDPNPERVAKVYEPLTSITADQTDLAFTIPSSGAEQEPIIFAFSGTPPTADGRLQQHDGNGNLRLKLLRELIPGTPEPSKPVEPPVESSVVPPVEEITTESDYDMDLPPLTTNQRLILVHAVLLSFAFVVILPLGALVGRLTRAHSPAWFKRHWILQAVVAGPCILIGFALGIFVVWRRQGIHWAGLHKQMGFILVFIIYPGQLCLGYVIHRVKSPNMKRPIRNYLHVFIGLSIIALAFWQVWLGFDSEWPRVTGRGDVADGWYWAWKGWATCVGLLYLAGLWLLPRQFEQERRMREYKVLPRETDERFAILDHDTSPRESEEFQLAELKVDDESR